MAYKKYQGPKDNTNFTRSIPFWVVNQVPW
jgi:hypothetical protein